MILEFRRIQEWQRVKTIPELKINSLLKSFGKHLPGFFQRGE